MAEINARVVGKITAAPTPIAARAAINPCTESACAATALVTANKTRPAMSQPRLPKRSLRVPADSSNAEITSV